MTNLKQTPIGEISRMRNKGVVKDESI